MIVAPLLRTSKLRYDPAPKLIWSTRQKLGLGVRGMAQLIPTLSNCGVFSEYAMHRAYGASIPAFLEQGGVHLDWCEVGKTLFVEGFQNLLSLRRGQFSWRRWSPRPRAIHRGAMAIVSRAGNSECCACQRGTKGWCNLNDPVHDLYSSLFGGGSAIPKSCDTFYWIATKASARSARFRSSSFCRNSVATCFA